MPDYAEIDVLLVEDSAVSAKAIHALLAQIGLIRVAVTFDARSALERLRWLKPPALVISDWRLEGMSGLELLRRIREDAALKDIRFLLVTASGHPQLADTVHRLGADGFLIKPFTAEVLGEAIARILRRGSKAG